MTEPRTTCPDCGGALAPIKLLDATDRRMESGVGHVEIGYATRSSVPSDLTGSIPESGKVKARMCADCGRILLYGDRHVGLS